MAGRATSMGRCLGLLARWLLLPTAFALACGDASGPRPPNLIVVLTDDQGYRDWQAENPAIHTPELARLAAEGMVLEQFHVMPACSPTRAALLTGRHGRRTGVTGLMNHRPDDHRAMSTEEVTIAELLQLSGYRTALVGKWHLSDRPGSVADYGFDEFFGFLRGSTRYVDPANFYRNATPLGTLRGYSTDLLADEAVAFIERNRDRPFFLLLAPNAPHEVVVGKDEDLALYPPASQSEEERHFYATITSVDRALGRVRRALERNGLERDTRILVTSDNGPARYPRAKGTLHRWAMQVPFVAWGPGHVPVGRSAPLADVLDLFPTLAEWAGVPPAPGHVRDGSSLADRLAGAAPGGPSRMLFREWSGSYAAFDDAHRLILHRSEDGTLLPLLFDTTRDPAEWNDLLRVEAPGAHEVYGRMRDAIEQWQRTVRGDPHWRLPQVRISSSRGRDR